LPSRSSRSGDYRPRPDDRARRFAPLDLFEIQLTIGRVAAARVDGAPPASSTKADWSR
jgi:hypothetical protein